MLIDFSKAFDRVDHSIFLNKIVHTSISHFMIKWITSFWSNPKQRVIIGDHKSEWVHIKAGVPPMYKNGRSCFLLHINHLHTSCDMVKYVDDSTIMESCIFTREDSQLQTAADQCDEWSDRNLMGSNCDNTKFMHS